MLKHLREIIEISGTWDLDQSRLFCKKLAQSHYENFVVGSLFVPAPLRQHFFNLYAYCRISDDLGDEIADPREALEMLDLWQAELDQCFQGAPRHPVFVALRDTIERFSIPRAPFADLLFAFRQDQWKTRYGTFEELLDYCTYSANPVGRLVLYLFGIADAERQRLSDCTCTALQLANHWQDVARDMKDRDRIYLPQEDMAHFDYTEEDLRKQLCDARFTALMAFQCERTRAMFEEGLALANSVPRRLAIEIEMFGNSGLRLLGLIRKAGYDVFGHRPTVSKLEHTAIFLRACLRRAMSHEG